MKRLAVDEEGSIVPVNPSCLDPLLHDLAEGYPASVYSVKAAHTMCA